MEHRKIIYQGGAGEIVEKKSRFIATVAPVRTEQEALEYMCQCPQTGGSGQMLPPDFLNGELNNRTVWKDG